MFRRNGNSQLIKHLNEFNTLNRNVSGIETTIDTVNNDVDLLESQLNDIDLSNIADDLKDLETKTRYTDIKTNSSITHLYKFNNHTLFFLNQNRSIGLRFRAVSQNLYLKCIKIDTRYIYPNQQMRLIKLYDDSDNVLFSGYLDTSNIIIDTVLYFSIELDISLTSGSYYKVGIDLINTTISDSICLVSPTQNNQSHIDNITSIYSQAGQHGILNQSGVYDSDRHILFPVFETFNDVVILSKPINMDTHLLYNCNVMLDDPYSLIAPSNSQITRIFRSDSQNLQLGDVITFSNTTKIKKSLASENKPTIGIFLQYTNIGTCIVCMTSSVCRVKLETGTTINVGDRLIQSIVGNGCMTKSNTDLCDAISLQNISNSSSNITIQCLIK